jgi:adenylosuccinate synthase
MPMKVVVGLQWGDEGKGKIVDYLSQDADVVARWNGGANAGHTVWLNHQKHVTHLLPSGLLQGKVCVLGNGMVIDPERLLQEIKYFEALQINTSPRQIMVSDLAHIVLPTHKALDVAKEEARGGKAIGTTRQGISFAYRDKEKGCGLEAWMMRSPHYFGQQVHQLVEVHNQELIGLGSTPLNADTIANQYEEYANHLADYIQNVSAYLEKCLKNGRNVLAEGAQGTLLDKTYGTVPYVTRSSTIASSAPVGLGVDPKWVNRVIGVAKCFQTRVGEGPMPTELQFDSVTAKHLRSEGKPGEEKGATTGRPRRVGWLDKPLLQYATALNNVDEVVLTKLDVLSGLESVKTCEAYNYHGYEVKGLPAGAITNLYDCIPQYVDRVGWSAKEISSTDLGLAEFYVKSIERSVGVLVSLVSVGVDRKDVVRRKG